MRYKCFTSILLLACFITGCKKNCLTNYKTVNSYLYVFPETKTFKTGDTLYWNVSSSFTNINQRNGENINIKKTKNISDFIINLARVDSITRPPGGYDNGLNFVDIIPMRSERFRVENINGVKGNVIVRFANDSESFLVKIMVILKSKGVYMLEHGPSTGLDNSCNYIDFIPALKNISQNEELFRAYPFNAGLSIRETHYFFKVE
ncbi:MAG: hypothetical protein K2Q24_09150 [Chitinophagaceae bacterium]|nr:hypothetical protein [Chitinophagaceae bacterium]